MKRTTLSSTTVRRRTPALIAVGALTATALAGVASVGPGVGAAATDQSRGERGAGPAAVESAAWINPVAPKYKVSKDQKVRATKRGVKSALERAWDYERKYTGGNPKAAKQLAAKEGIADPNRIAIVGWSYGGYAALQSAAIEPSLYKTAVAIALLIAGVPPGAAE